MQSSKCCYCEKRQEQAAYRDVEHFRPKSIYPWLTWTWENLLFACVDCNREHKRDQFPLVQGTKRLSCGQSPLTHPAIEQPLLLDPADPSVVPAEHIGFTLLKVQGRERWMPIGLTAQGKETIKVCGLDRPSLLDLYAEHIKSAVHPRIAHVHKAIADDNAYKVGREWDRARQSLLDPGKPFRALSYFAMRTLVRKRHREDFKLTLEHP